MRVEYDFASDSRRGLVEVDALIHHARPDSFEHRKTAVTLIHVEHAGGDGHRAQGAYATHTEQQLLADADAAIAAIQTRGELAIFRRVAVHIRIE